MRKVCGLLLVALVFSVSAHAADDFKLEDGYELIFNGKNLDGWKEFSGKDKAKLDGKKEAYKGRFAVKDGVLHIDPSVKGDLHIETVKEFGKGTHIKFDFKPGEKCNNDIFFQGTKFDIVLPKKDAKGPKLGEWATFEIVVGDDKIEHKINGAVARTTKTSDKIGKASPLRIRAEFGSIEIKNVRAKK